MNAPFSSSASWRDPRLLTRCSTSVAFLFSYHVLLFEQLLGFLLLVWIFYWLVLLIPQIQEGFVTVFNIRRLIESKETVSPWWMYSMCSPEWHCGSLFFLQPIRFQFFTVAAVLLVDGTNRLQTLFISSLHFSFKSYDSCSVYTCHPHVCRVFESLKQRKLEMLLTSFCLKTPEDRHKTEKAGKDDAVSHICKKPSAIHPVFPFHMPKCP